ncbi:MAG TPA: trehalose-phosphatase [Candidatus Binatia bacterium]|nr:trehalose-phosphatase [Candidatus Binatia bacterium]
MNPLPPVLERGDALFLDFDGTLAEIAPRPDLVRVDTPLVEDLFAVQRALQGCVALVTGRRLAEVDRFLHPLVLLGAGLHGAELRTAQGVSFADARADALAQAVAALRDRFDAAEGVLIEDKGLSVAVHYRNAPDWAQHCERAVRELSERLQLKLLRGKAVVELRGANVDKGDALRTLMRLDGFHRRRPVFLGDDATDEDGFAAVDALGGITVKVGPEASRARHCLPDVTAVHDWLRRSRDALGQEQAA